MHFVSKESATKVVAQMDGQVKNITIMPHKNPVDRCKDKMRNRQEESHVFFVFLFIDVFKFKKCAS